MKPFKCLFLAACFLLLSPVFFVQSAWAAIPTTPAGHDKFRIHTGLPKRQHDSLFSYTVEWRLDDGELYRSTGLSFLNASKVDNATGSVHTAKKLHTAIKDALIQLDPNWRGISINHPENLPELIISNKQGFSMTSVTIKDYSNQAMTFDLVDKSFVQEGVQIGIDLVYTSDVEYLEGFSSKKTLSASHGEIEVSIEGQKPVLIKTDGKTTQQLEEELAKLLNKAQTSKTALYEGVLSSDTRNNKPFDGHEVQLLNLSANSISIDVRDPELGVLVKFKYRDENHSVKMIEPRFMLGFLAVASILTVVIIRLRNSKKSV